MSFINSEPYNMIFILLCLFTAPLNSIYFKSIVIIHAFTQQKLVKICIHLYGVFFFLSWSGHIQVGTRYWLQINNQTSIFRIVYLLWSLLFLCIYMIFALVSGDKLCISKLIKNVNNFPYYWETDYEKCPLIKWQQHL